MEDEEKPDISKRPQFTPHSTSTDGPIRGPSLPAALLCEEGNLVRANGGANPAPSQSGEKLIQSDGGAPPVPSHTEGDAFQLTGVSSPSCTNLLQRKPTRADSKYKQDTQDGEKPRNILQLPSDRQGEGNTKNTSKVAPEVRYDTFVREIIGCLNELKRAETAQGVEEVVEGESNGDDNSGSEVLSESEEFELVQSGTIPSDGNDGCATNMEEFNSGTSMRVGEEYSTFNTSDAYSCNNDGGLQSSSQEIIGCLNEIRRAENAEGVEEVGDSNGDDKSGTPGFTDTEYFEPISFETIPCDVKDGCGIMEEVNNETSMRVGEENPAFSASNVHKNLSLNNDGGEIIGYLNELRKAEYAEGVEEEAQEGEGDSNGEGKSGTPGFTESEYFEPIPSGVNDGCVITEEVNNETSMRVREENSALNASNVHKNPSHNNDGGEIIGSLNELPLETILTNAVIVCKENPAFNASSAYRNLSCNNDGGLRSSPNAPDPENHAMDAPPSHKSGIKLPVPKNLEGYCWRVKNDRERTLELGSSGFSYTGGVVHGRMHGFGRLTLGDREQFVEGIWNMNHLVELHSSHLFSNRGNQMVFIIKRRNDHLLTTYDNHFVARVTFKSIEELNFTLTISHIKNSFFRKLIVLEQVADELQDKRQQLLDKFVARLMELIDMNADSVVRANTIYLLSLYLGRKDPVFTDLFEDRNIPANVRAAAHDLLHCESNYLKNSSLFSNRAAKRRLDMRNILSKVYIDGVAIHRQMLLGKCPKAFPRLSSFIEELSSSKIVYLSVEDMQVFDHLASLPSFEHHEDFFKDCAERYQHTICNIKTSIHPCTMIPIMSPVYGFLAKSLWETILEIIQVVAAYKHKDMLIHDSGKWKLQENIQWPEIVDQDEEKHKPKFFKTSGNASSLSHKLLEIQYNVIFKLLTQLSPENCVANWADEYEFHVLETERLSWWEKNITRRVARKKVGLAKRLQHLPTERRIWLCLLDGMIHELFKDDPQSQILLKPYNSLLEGQISFIEKSSSNSHETFRVMTHSILKFIASTAPYFKEVQEKPGVDVEILVQQMWTLSTASQELDEDPTTFSNFRDLIEEYNRYLNLRMFINIDSSSEYFSARISQIMHTFMNIVATSLKKSASTAALVGYLRSLNDFLDDFKNIGFQSTFFIKSESFDPEVMEKVDNQLTGVNCSYKVIDIEKFVQVTQPVPRHHLMEVVLRLLECISGCLDKKWQSGDGELEVVQLDCTALLMDAIRKSFMYLKEQPDYVDFELFERESTEPFESLFRECQSLEDLKKRVSKVGESFWYIRKMDEIGIDRALKMFESVNDCLDTSVLRECYNLYLTHYDEYIAMYRSLLSEGKSHDESLADVVQSLAAPHPFHFSMWTEEFKTKQIPVFLAGLGAVWSIMVSKDVSATGKFLKPHCIQVLCILRLLSADLPDGAENHLAQVLTGQGKSVILGLLSSVLTLTGHKVRVLCYSEYLSTRDYNDFHEFFSMFQLSDKIVYETFESMAEGFINPVVGGEELSLRDMVKNRVLNHTSWPLAARLTPASKNTILLADEVDVFFTDKFYGETYDACDVLGFAGLAQVQEFIWGHVSGVNDYSSEQIVLLSKNHIENGVTAGNEAMMEFSNFLDKRGTFPLLEEDNDGNYFVKSYTNSSLFDEHLNRMADTAKRVADPNYNGSDFMISDDGVITLKDSTYAIYCKHLRQGYYNVFNYFRLKKSNYDPKGFLNYGYMILGAGSVSYARLPSQFQLILGVSGTLSDLGEYEKSGIESYGIHNFSILPSFFGESNLQFSKETDFHFFNTQQEWLKEIYERAVSVVESRRAALIFFETDIKMAIFSKEYRSKFDRLHEITENTFGSLRDKYIDEAGLSSTVTLATGGMGRGVDYKSSLTVEKNGGVHVVQTYFSVDVKEEVQIKGRTARKDNKGSYELIVCKEHLPRRMTSAGDLTVYTYDSLARIREEMSREKGGTVNENLKRSEQNHSVTMKYFGLI